MTLHSEIFQFVKALAVVDSEMLLDAAAVMDAEMAADVEAVDGLGFA